MPNDEHLQHDSAVDMIEGARSAMMRKAHETLAAFGGLVGAQAALAEATRERPRSRRSNVPTVGMSPIERIALGQDGTFGDAIAADSQFMGGTRSTISVADNTTGQRWCYTKMRDGLLMEVARHEPNGDIVIAPHATVEDLREAVRVLLAEVYRARTIGDMATVPTLCVDVRL